MKIYKEHNISGLGYNFNLDEAYEQGKADGEHDGYENGYRDGYADGLEECQNEAPA